MLFVAVPLRPVFGALMLLRCPHAVRIARSSPRRWAAVRNAAFPERYAPIASCHVQWLAAERGQVPILLSAVAQVLPETLAFKRRGWPKPDGMQGGSKGASMAGHECSSRWQRRRDDMRDFPGRPARIAFNQWHVWPDLHSR